MGGAGLIGSLSHLTNPFSVEGGVGGPLQYLPPLLCAHSFQWQRPPSPLPNPMSRSGVLAVGGCALVFCWFHSASFFGYIYQNNNLFLTNNIGTLAQSLRSTISPFRVEVHGSIPGPSNHFDGMTPHGCSRCCSLSLIISMMTKHLRGCVRSSAACSSQ